MPGPNKPLYNPHGMRPSKPAPPASTPAQQRAAHAALVRGSDMNRMFGSKNTGTNAFGSATPLNIRGLQQQLVKAGYKLAVDGQLGPQTLSALRDFYGQPSESASMFKHQLTDPSFASKGGGVGHPVAWNKTHVNVSAPFKQAQVNAGGMDTNMGGAGSVDLSGAQQALTGATGSAIPLKYSQFGTMIDPATAQDIAGAQYDPQIASAQLAVNQDPLQGAQNLKDIGSWYGQVGAAQQTAAARDHAMTVAGTGSISDAAAALLSSAGGDANQGAHDIAGAGQNALGTIAAEGASTDQYNNDIAPLLAAEGAEQRTNQSRLDAKQLLADRSSLTSLQSAKGQAAQAALAGIEGQNNSLAQARAQMADQILGQNNSLGQQTFSNQLALSQAQIAAMMSGLAVQGLSSKNAKAANPNGFNYWSPTARLNTQNTAIAALQGMAKRGIKVTPQVARQTIASIYQGNGVDPNNPAVQQAINGTLNEWVSGSGGV